MQTLKKLTDILCEELGGEKKGFYDIRAGDRQGKRERYVAIYIMKYIYGYQSKHIIHLFGYSYNDIITYSRRYVEDKEDIDRIKQIAKISLERFYSGS